jgi:pseudaminic acid cytidylyltransferase
MHNLCIIPARGGSKRIPRKNIRHFLGKPIIAYSIDTAITSKLFDNVIVSTDDEEIASVARKHGAIVPFKRSERNSDDYATTAQVIEEVLSNFSDANSHFDNVCCLYPTAPLVLKDDLIAGYDTLKNGGYDSVFPVVAFGYPVWRGLRIDDTGRIRMIWPENLNKRSQDLEEMYHDAGQWYWLTSGAFKRNLALYTSNSYPIVLDDLHVQDIDNLSDWKLAELKFKIINNEL